METTEVAGAKKGYRKKTQAQSYDIGGGVQAEVSNAADQNVSGNKVESAPQHVDGRRGEPFASRLGEGALKGMAHQSARKVWDGVAKKHAAEKVRKEIQPVHLSLSFAFEWS